MTRKTTRGLSRIVKGLEDCLHLGNLDAKRGWGHAKDFLRMQWMLLQQSSPKDYVISTGIQVSVREFVSKATEYLGITLQFEGSGLTEVGKITAIEAWRNYPLTVGQVVVRVDERYFRPAEVETLMGDASMAKMELGWGTEISWENLCQEMVQYDLRQHYPKIN